MQRGITYKLAINLNRKGLRSCDYNPRTLQVLNTRVRYHSALDELRQKPQVGKDTNIGDERKICDPVVRSCIW